MKAAEHTFFLFRDKSGSEHIFSLNALRGFLKLVRHKKVRSVLELGIGIGTVPYLLQRAKQCGELAWSVRYFGTEADKFCISAFQTNVPEHASIIAHYQTLEEVPKNNYELIIVDGREDGLEKIIDLLAPRGTIFVEGGRASQINILEKSETKRRFLKSSELSFFAYLRVGHPGGFTTFTFEPTITDRMRYYKNRMVTPVKYKVVASIRWMVNKLKKN